jgi:hypothetical protein
MIETISYFKKMNGWKLTILAIIVLFLAIVVTPRWLDTLYEDYFVDWTPSILHKLVVTNQNKKICQGGELYYDVHMTKIKDYSFKIKRELVNSYSIHYDTLTPPRKPLGPDQVFPQKIYVPKSAEVGDWKLRWTVEYDIPPHGSQKSWTIYSITGDSDKFWVVECE